MIAGIHIPADVSFLMQINYSLYDITYFDKRNIFWCQGKHKIQAAVIQDFAFNFCASIALSFLLTP